MNMQSKCPECGVVLATLPASGLQRCAQQLCKSQVSFVVCSRHKPALGGRGNGMIGCSKQGSAQRGVLDSLRQDAMTVLCYAGGTYSICLRYPVLQQHVLPAQLSWCHGLYSALHSHGSTSTHHIGYQYCGSG